MAPLTALAGRSDQVPGQLGRTAPVAVPACRSRATVVAAAAGPGRGLAGAGHGGAGAWPG